MLPALPVLSKEVWNDSGSQEESGPCLSLFREANTDAPMAFNSMYDTEESMDHIWAFPTMCSKLSAIQQKYFHLNIWKVSASS